MNNNIKNSISFRLWGKYALFTDPITKLGGEKCSYLIPTYEAIKGVIKSIYWKPTIIWYVDKLRVIKPLQTQTKGIKPLNWGGGNSLANYNYLYDQEYQISAHFEWNKYRPELIEDRIYNKHFSITKRALKKGGRYDISLGTRECQGYVEPCEFGDGVGAYDDINELSFGSMVYGFDYPDETGKNELGVSFWSPTMTKGIVEFPKPGTSQIRKFIRKMKPKKFKLNSNTITVEKE